MNIQEKILVVAFAIIFLLFLVFSYAYVDFNLTLSNNRYFLNFVSFMQELGYYNRPIARIVYLLLAVGAFALYSKILHLAYRSKISAKFLIYAVVITSALMVIAYPLFSRDIFNYLFDAKIIVKYHLSPYSYRPIDFTGDEWLRFTHWLHRYSPYGPFWLIVSTIPYILGFGKFVSTLFLFKFFMACFHILNTFIIYKILLSLKNKKIVFYTAFYALNPLLLIEGIANGHNDVIQSTFILLPILFFSTNKKILSTFSLLAGILIKYISLLLIPVLAIEYIFRKINIKRAIVNTFVLTVTVTILFSTVGIKPPFINSASTQVQFQPWYLFWSLPLVSLINSPLLIIFTAVVSFGAMLRYIPYIKYGDWSNEGTTEFMLAAVIVPPLIAAIIYIYRHLLITKK